MRQYPFGHADIGLHPNSVNFLNYYVPG